MKTVADGHRHAALVTIFSGVNIDDLEWHWIPKIEVFSEFLAILGCDTHFKNELRQNGWR